MGNWYCRHSRGMKATYFEIKCVSVYRCPVNGINVGIYAHAATPDHLQSGSKLVSLEQKKVKWVTSDLCR